MLPDTIRIATRRSPLALWQAEHVRSLLQAAHPALQIDLLPLVTEADRRTDVALSRLGGKGLFIKELEQALDHGEADLAVHSMKDVPISLPDGLVLALVLARADARDALISPRYQSFEALPENARVGTSSLRRQCQLKHARPDLQIELLRGNVGTRLRRVDEGEFAATLLAVAGLERLGLEARIDSRLSPEICLPAIGQGVIGIECRDDPALLELLAPLAHADSAGCIRAERALAARLGGSCQLPVAGYATLQHGELHLRGLIGHPDGSTLLREATRGPVSRAEVLGWELGERLLDAGGRRILATLGLKEGRVRPHQPLLDTRRAA